jgi:hypothetical protein
MSGIPPWPAGSGGGAQPTKKGLSPEDEDSPQRRQWMAYRKYKG